MDKIHFGVAASLWNLLVSVYDGCSHYQMACRTVKSQRDRALEDLERYLHSIRFACAECGEEVSVPEERECFCEECQDGPFCPKCLEEHTSVHGVSTH